MFFRHSGSSSNTVRIDIELNNGHTLGQERVFHIRRNLLQCLILLLLLLLLLISLQSPPHNDHHKTFHEMPAAWWSQARGEVFAGNGIVTGVAYASGGGRVPSCSGELT
jgi:uncharacterized membrane protein YfcA